MSAPNAATRQPFPHSPFRRLVARHPVVSFLLMAVMFAGP